MPRLPPLASLQITLAPCTVLQPHIHPHPEFLFSITGECAALLGPLSSHSLSNSSLSSSTWPGARPCPVALCLVAPNCLLA